MDVSVCIVNWNTKDLLRNCIAAIKEKTTGVSYEIVVVDNNSSDGSQDMLRTEYPDCKLIASTENLGFARGNNHCVKHTTGEYILYLNPDTELITNAIYGMYSFLETNKNVGAAGCKLIYPDGKIQYTCASTFPTPFREFSSLFLLNRIFPKSKCFSARELDYWDHMESREVDCLSGACIMAKRELIERLGGFDEKIFMYSEDLDLCYKILKEGFSIYYLSTEAIMHYEGASSKKRSSNFAPLLQKQSNYYFISKNYGDFQARCFRMATFAGSLFRILITVPLFIAAESGMMNKDIDPSNILDKYINILLWSIRIKTLPIPN